jgi:hypothetical protein
MATGMTAPSNGKQTSVRAMVLTGPRKTSGMARLALNVTLPVKLEKALSVSSQWNAKQTLLAYK